jgi:hypothetical protein
MATLFKTLRGQVRDKLVELYAVAAPGGLTAVVVGTAGTKTIVYQITALNSLGETTGSVQVSVTTANATLSGSNYVQLNWVASDNATSYNVYRVSTNGTSPTTVGKIANTTNLTLNDTGLAGDATTAPTENTTGVTNPFWSDAELHESIVKGVKDLWRGIIDLHKNHFAVIDDTNVSQVAGNTTLTGVPSDCFRVLSIEPRDITQDGAGRSIIYKPKPYQDPDFQRDRSLASLQLSYPEWVYYDIINPGAPTGAPTIIISRKLATTLLLRLVYVKTLPSTYTESDTIPIPGEADNALLAWTVAFARSKEHPERLPDPAWLSIYGTDKQNLLTALTPRQEQEPEIVEDVFAGAWGY